MKNKTARVLTESAIMIALATVLSLIKIVHLPYGGSVTIASMLPIAIIAYRHGVSWGLLAGFVHGVIQNLLGLSDITGLPTWKSVLVAVLLDYLVAFAVIGLAGAFRKAIKNQAFSLSLGCVLACVLRYICHVITGATIWAGLSIPSAAALSFSFIYNATYMLPETIILFIAALYVGSTLDFNAEMPTRLIRKESVPANVSWIYPVMGLIATAATIFDVAKVFAKLQDGETGKFAITNITEVNWVMVGIVTAVAIFIDVVLFFIRRAVVKKDAEQ